MHIHDMCMCVQGQAEVDPHLSLLWLDVVANNINGHIMKQFANHPLLSDKLSMDIFRLFKISKVFQVF